MKRWLKITDAAEYSAIGIHRLKQLAVDGVIRGFKDPDSKRGDWIFDALSLDAYRESQAGSNPTPQEKALAIMRGVRL